ncbi:Carbohydrate kinase PfkB [Corchorus olitorius]|uniref:Carbohydrate kinase PfkB n=1 Tax=Corchorus olitorius TaxID=93759 RepID=A0A1R3KQU4_9ROSI|nr:Carbohydrate kinase PfkB [Corchorus olitorius]
MQNCISKVILAKLSYPTYFVGQVGDDANGKLITEALGNGGVRLEYLKSLGKGVPTGHAVVENPMRWV